MRLKDILEKIELRRRDEFLRFIQTGEGTGEFLAYVDSDAKAREAVDAAVNLQAEALREIARLIREPAVPAEESTTVGSGTTRQRQGSPETVGHV